MPEPYCCRHCHAKQYLRKLENEIVRLVVDPSQSFYRGDRIRYQNQYAAALAAIDATVDKFHPELPDDE